MLGMAAGLQALLIVVAMLIASFLVNPIAAAVVLLVGVLLILALRPFNKLSSNASAQLSSKSRSMATLVTEYTRLTWEFRILGIEQEAIGELEEHNLEAALSFGRSKRLATLPRFFTKCLLLLL